MLYQPLTWSMMFTFVPSWMTNRSFDDVDEGELLTEDTGDITMAVSAERQSLFCQREKLKADTESTSATTPLKKPILRLEAVEPRRKSRNIASAITRKTKNKVTQEFEPIR